MRKRVEDILQKAADKILNFDVSSLRAAGLFEGKLGLAQYSLSRYKAERDEAYLQIIQQVLESIFESLAGAEAEAPAASSLFDGIPGLGIILYKLVEEGFLEETYRESIQAMSESAFENGLQKVSRSNFDYFYGATGILFYLDAVGATEYAERMVKALHQHAETHDYLFYSDVADPYSQGINFGLARGTFSVLAVLLKIYRKRRQPELEALLVKATDALLRFKKGRIDPSKIIYEDAALSYPAFFPYKITTTRKDRRVRPDASDLRYRFTPRLAWCNSDLSRALMLYKLGETFDKADYIQTADEIGREAVKRRTFEHTGIQDAYLCHGSGGVALLFDALFERTQNPRYQSAYEHWIAVTADFMEAALKEPCSAQSLSLLSGWLGPLLVLHAYRDKSTSDWKDLFLIN